MDALYGEADAAVRARVEAHLALCAACREEMAALGGVRRDLRAWAAARRRAVLHPARGRPAAVAGRRRAPPRRLRSDAGRRRVCLAPPGSRRAGGPSHRDRAAAPGGGAGPRVARSTPPPRPTPPPSSRASTPASTRGSARARPVRPSGSTRASPAGRSGWTRRGGWTWPGWRPASATSTGATGSSSRGRTSSWATSSRRPPRRGEDHAVAPNAAPGRASHFSRWPGPAPAQGQEKNRSVAAREGIEAIEARLARAVDRVSLPHAARLLGRVESARGYRLPGYGLVLVLTPRMLPGGEGQVYVLRRGSPKPGHVRVESAPAGVRSAGGDGRRGADRGLRATGARAPARDRGRPPRGGGGHGAHRPGRAGAGRPARAARRSVPRRGAVAASPPALEVLVRGRDAGGEAHARGRWSPTCAGR